MFFTDWNKTSCILITRTALPNILTRETIVKWLSEAQIQTFSRHETLKTIEDDVIIWTILYRLRILFIKIATAKKFSFNINSLFTLKKHKFELYFFACRKTKESFRNKVLTARVMFKTKTKSYFENCFKNFGKNLTGSES